MPLSDLSTTPPSASAPREHTYDEDDFAAALGASLDSDCAARIRHYDFRYRRLLQEERDAVVLRILRRLDDGDYDQAGAHRLTIWEAGWNENLEAFRSSGESLDALTPRFLREATVVRIAGEFAQALDPRFERNYFAVVRQCLANQYLAEVDTVHEFGCGSGHNLVALAEFAPHCKLHGLDWAESAVRLVNEVAAARRLPLRGTRFDLFNPSPQVRLGSRDAVLTVCALEQLGARHEAFLEYLLAQRPAICVHMEPLVELYEPARLADYLAIRYHRARNYLSGFVGRLQELAAGGSIEILALRRLGFGSLFHEGYSIAVWRPR